MNNPVHSHAEPAVSVEALEQLVARQQAINRDIDRLNGLREAEERRFRAILSEFGCSTLAEFQALVDRTEAEARALHDTLKSEIEERAPRLAEIQKRISE